MAGKTDFWSNAVLNIIRGTAASTADPLFIGLFSVSPDDDYIESSPNGTEVTGNFTNSNRQPIAAAQWNAPSAAATFPSGREISNTTGAPISWTDWDAGGNPDQLNHFGVLDEVFSTPTGSGDLLYYGPIVPTREINDGETATFNGGTPGDLVLNED